VSSGHLRVTGIRDFSAGSKGLKGASALRQRVNKPSRKGLKRLDG
jgi:hypothetical protein